MRHDAIKKPWQQPYDGPFPILARTDHYYTLDLNGHSDSVSVDRLKPAYVDFSLVTHLHPHHLLLPAPLATPATTPSQPAQGVPPICSDTAPVPSATRTTRSGCRIHWPTHLKDFAS